LLLAYCPALLSNLLFYCHAVLGQINGDDDDDDDESIFILPVITFVHANKQQNSMYGLCE